MYAEILEGAYDLHVHTGPDVSPRKLDDLDMAERLRKIGMKGFGIKSHYFCTAERARLVKKLYPDINPLGAVCLNYPTGGINPAAVEMAARDGAKIVWMPTFDAANELDYLLNQGSYGELPPWAKVQLELNQQGKGQAGISILEDGKLTKSTLDVLDIVAQHRLILATGHLSKTEIFALVKAAKEQQVKNIVITHPTFSSVNLSKEEQKELAELGAYLEQCFGVITPVYGIDWDGLYETIQYVGPAHCILSSDLGQVNNPYPDEGMITFVQNLLENGFTKAEIKKMTVENTTMLAEG
ncbi:DUF6282 family protein [Brevibacillus ruminantium]|uniref:DUF6282 family protein n=1 Tax=Brevibacillus ruminantium TaxID=2950604 RepID=A0ABY4WCW9_9BACL|nr:DUF6282 family protein [Brevibacillus ruminantium]USG64696.1 DUF6282 family protein [Brevibacillus ruminantium]